MKYIGNKKGQGFDTFKLLIAAVVAMIILGIVTGVFSKIYNWIFRLECPSGGAISTIVTAIQDAKTGYDKTTDNMCMNEREGFSSSAITEKISLPMRGINTGRPNRMIRPVMARNKKIDAMNQ